MNIAEQIKAHYSKISPSSCTYIVSVTSLSEMIEEAEVIINNKSGVVTL